MLDGQKIIMRVEEGERIAIGHVSIHFPNESLKLYIDEYLAGEVVSE